ncbi:hypothetical protein M409DRAFT_69796 [Zasmidium cellare ATCC 36951]|uniref:Spindle pole body component n=1 Tax=Zasmidium cellare ATCC 36951 TaxID=1080233 RepID=A0A6A6C6E6_ZASCE|nr:uncharacterized protein M409DRAFT_69796 [Zasmidium cellare ATCC 36951]KAF2161452.1 hypothetical protein M409DRAFT_69796 [Zasmidium cellare ATCC 36951]
MSWTPSCLNWKTMARVYFQEMTQSRAMGFQQKQQFLHEDETPRLCTWESLEKRNLSDTERVPLISEAGPAAFDAAINLLPQLRNDVGVLPQDYALRALCNLALGRSSTIFQWNAKILRFEQTLKGASITGVSRACLDSLAEEIIDTGSTIAKLRTVAERQRYAKIPSATLALNSCVRSILNAIDECMSEQLSSVRSVLQLQNLLAAPKRLLSVLEALVEATKQCESDESVISAVSDHIYDQVQTQYDLCAVLRALLARVSVPWLERLATDIGFCSTETALASGYSIDSDNMSGLEQAITFVDADYKDLIRETKRAVKILRTQDEYHYLLRGDEQAFNALVNPTLDRTELLNISKTYEQMMANRLRSDPAAITSNTLDKLGQPTGRARPENIELATDLSTTPLERIRPLVQTQQRLVNGILLRRLFREHNLRHHLEVQKSYQLLGNADFVLRLSTALFSQETQSAERRRGATLTGEVMGLRLGATHEERWPPASSELQLTLMGILNETYGKISEKKSANGAALPGGLSFSIRQLPESEIDRVLDPNSVYALDFLRLQYTTTPPLDAVITSDTLDKYDGTFRFLLRLLRVGHVTSTLKKVLSSHWKPGHPDVEACKFVQEANQVVCVLMSHAMELGIIQPWRSFQRSIDGLVQVLAREDEAGEIGTKVTLGVEGLRCLHEQCLESIRGRLFLKRRQAKLRQAIEDALNAILKATFALQRDDKQVRAIFKDNKSSFTQSTKEIVKLLQEIVDKPLKTISAAEAEDMEVSRILLSRLNWNEYYT